MIVSNPALLRNDGLWDLFHVKHACPDRKRIMHDDASESTIHLVKIIAHLIRFGALVAGKSVSVANQAAHDVINDGIDSKTSSRMGNRHLFRWQAQAMGRPPVLPK